MSDARHDETPIPDRVGPYRIVEQLGAGGMGVVYRARDERLERWVAVKHIRPGEADLRSRERLRREARTIAGLNHSAIVQVHDIVETGEGDWIVMELIEGRTLKEMIDDDALDLPEVVQLAREIAEGLAEAHAKGIVHRDLKTENVKVTDLGHAKILDFGLAKRDGHAPNEDSLSVQGAILGTYRAMSPEQALGEEVDHRSDLFSFGILLFEAVTRRRPFEGSSLILTLAQICTEEQPSARKVSPAVPRDLSELIDHLLAKDPLQRPQSAGEVVDALERIAARMASRSASAGDDPSDTAVAPALPLAPPIAGRPSPPAGRFASRGSGGRAMAARSSESTAGFFVKTLVEIALIDARLGDRFGDAGTYELCSRLDRLARDVLAEHDGLEVHKTEEGFLFLFERPVDAVEFTLAYHQRLAEFAADVEIDLKARGAIHLSEVFLRENTPEEIHRGAHPLEAEGLAKRVVARLVTLADGGRTLLTQEAHDMARRSLVGHPLAERDLRWWAHGHYLFRGVDETVRVFEVAAEPIDPGAGLREAPEAQRVEGGEGRLRRGRRGGRFLLAAAAVVLAVVGSTLVSLYALRESSRSAAESAAARPDGVRPSLAVLGFRNLGGRAEDEWLATALAELLTTDLAAGEDLRLVAGESVARLKRSRSFFEGEALAPDTLGTIRDNLGADYAVLGSYLYLERNGQLTVQMKVQDTWREETFTVQETGPESGLLELVTRSGDQVRERLGLESIPRDRVRAVRATVSEDDEALRLYFEALEKLRGFEPLAARDLLLRALELDPGFAMAHVALSKAWQSLGYDREAEAYARQAFQLVRSSALPREDILQIEATYHEMARDWERAIDTYKVLWGFFPDDVDYGLRLAQAQVDAGRGDAALATVENLRRLPAPAREDPRIDLVEAAASDEQQRFRRVLETAQRASEKGRDLDNALLTAEAERLKGRALTRLGRLEEAGGALAEARRLFSETGDEVGLGKALYNLASLQLGKRNLSAAERHLRDALEIFLKTGSRKNIAWTQSGLAAMMQAKGQLAEARDLIVGAIETFHELGSQRLEMHALDTLVWVLLQSGDLNQADELGRRLIALSQELGHRSGEAWAYYNLAYVALCAGELTEAESRLGQVLAFAEETRERSLYVLANNMLGAVYLDQGDLVRSREAFERSWEQRSSGEWGEQSVTEARFALLMLELGKPAEGAELARMIAERYRKGEQPDYQAASLAVVARALRIQGRLEEAGATLEEALALGRHSQVADVRLRLAVDEAVFLAPTDFGDASRRLRHALGEARKYGLKSLELEATLALAEIEARHAPNEQQTGRSLARLHAVADEAQRLDFGLIARRAAEEIVRLEVNRHAAAAGAARPTG